MIQNSFNYCTQVPDSTFLKMSSRFRVYAKGKADMIFCLFLSSLRKKKPCCVPLHQSEKVYQQVTDKNKCFITGINKHKHNAVMITITVRERA